MTDLKTNLANVLKYSERPNSLDYIKYIFTDFISFSGDRIMGDDESIFGGVGFIDNIPVTVIGQIRGKNFQEQLTYNFSMTYPEGYRKALRLMRQAEKFKRPIICFVDTIGAYPGIEAEERGQVASISNNIAEMLCMKVPIISILIGNGGSGGALALCIADRIAILENAVYSVISPKACAEILWKDVNKEDVARELLKMTSFELKKQGLVDCILLEPNGNAYSDTHEMAICIKKYLLRELKSLKRKNYSNLIRKRQKRFQK